MPAPIPQILVLTFAVYLGVMIHEIGHALTGKVFGFVITSFGLGTAGPFLILPIGRTRFYLGLIQPFQGLTFAFLPRPFTDRIRLAAYVSGGIAANALCMAAALCLTVYLPLGMPSIFLGIFAAANALIAIVSLIPVHFRVGGTILRSDGKFLLEILRTDYQNSSIEDIQFVQGCRRLWRAVGDRMMERLCTLNAALSWLELGSPTKCESLLAEAADLNASHPYIDWLEGVTRANLALFRQEPSEVSLTLIQAVSCDENAGAEARYLLDLLRACQLHNEGRHAEAMAALGSLSEDLISRTRPELGMLALIGQLRAACAAGDEAAVSALLARYKASRVSLRSHVRDLHVYSASARFSRTRGLNASEDYYHALKAVGALSAEWRDSQDRDAFIDAQRTLIEEANQVLGSEITAKLIEGIGTPQSEHALPALKDPRRWWAYRLMWINLMSTATFVLFIPSIRPRGEPVLSLAIHLVLYTFLGAIYLLFDFGVSKRLPELKRLSGEILLTLALMPWIGWLAVCAVTMMQP